MSCSICNGTGKIPFVKDGKVIPHTFLFCECHEDEPEHSQPLVPNMFDFPISYSFYRSLCQQHGWQDPGPEQAPTPGMPPPPIFRPRPVDKEIDQLKAQNLYLQSKLNEHIDKSKKSEGKY